jgi:integrase
MIRQPEHEQLNRLNVKTLDQVREAIRLRHYSIRTEKAYVGWIKRFILLHNKRHPRDMGSPEGEAFLTHLTVDQLLEHRDVRTTMIYTHILNRGAMAIHSPPD